MHPQLVLLTLVLCAFHLGKPELDGQEIQVEVDADEAELANKLDDSMLQQLDGTAADAAQIGKTMTKACLKPGEVNNIVMKNLKLICKKYGNWVPEAVIKLVCKDKEAKSFEQLGIEIEEDDGQKMKLLTDELGKAEQALRSSNVQTPSGTTVQPCSTSEGLSPMRRFVASLKNIGNSIAGSLRKSAKKVVRKKTSVPFCYSHERIVNLLGQLHKRLKGRFGNYVSPTTSATKQLEHVGAEGADGVAQKKTAAQNGAGGGGRRGKRTLWLACCGTCVALLVSLAWIAAGVVMVLVGAGVIGGTYGAGTPAGLCLIIFGVIFVLIGL